MMDPQMRNLFADMSGVSSPDKAISTTEEMFANDDKFQNVDFKKASAPTGSDNNIDADSSMDKKQIKNIVPDKSEYAENHDIRDSSQHDKDLQNIYNQQNKLKQKTAELNKGNIILSVRRSNRSNKGVQREVFDPSHIPSPKYNKNKQDDATPHDSPIRKPKQAVLSPSVPEEKVVKEQSQRGSRKISREKKQDGEEQKEKSLKDQQLERKSRRISQEKKQDHKEQKQEVEEEEKSDSDSDDEYNDPNRLWCICRKPHNGRFMISCDVCEEWFHGDCVGVTVQRGKQMEKKGEEYVCPTCLKNKGKQVKQEQGTEKHASKISSKTGVKLKGYAHDKNADEISKNGKHSIKKRKLKNFDVKSNDRKGASGAKQRKCIVSNCPNRAPADSVYCSNVCILRHAKESLGGMGKMKKSSATVTPKAIPAESKQETKEERVVRKIKEAASRGKIAVMCRKTGKIFANASAPLKSELESFLKKNPTFKPLKLPKNFKLQVHEKPRDHHIIHSKKSQDDKHQSAYSHDPDYKPAEVKPSNPYKALTPSVKHSNDAQKAKKHKIDRQDSHDSKKSKHKRHDSSERRQSIDKHHNYPQKITPKRDSRSLSDDKNDSKKESTTHNEKEVRRSVKKTLQGILQARSNSSDDLKMHPDSINRLVNKIEDSLFKLFGSTSFKYKNRYRSISFNLKDEKNHGLWRKVILGEVTSSSLVKMTAEEMASKELAQWRKHELTQELEMIHELESAKKNIRPVSKITHKGEIAIDEDFSDLTESHLETSHEKAAPTIAPQRIRRISASQPESVAELSPVATDTTTEHNNHLFDMNCMICTGQIKEEDAHLLDSTSKSVKRSTSIILSNEAQSTAELEHSEEEILKKISAFSRKQENKSTVLSTKLSRSEEDSSDNEETHPISPDASFSQEDSSIEKKAPSLTAMKLSRDHFLWTGVISMPELSSFRTNAYTVSGGARELINSIPSKLVLDGRIHPKVVWEYLAKVSTFSNKEVCVIQFRASSEEDRVGYVSMLSYFSSRKRFGVVSNQNTQVIKDIYLVPLLETENVPKQLLPLRGPGLPTNHPSMLLGVIVRCIPEPKKSSPVIDTMPVKSEEKHHKSKVVEDDLPNRKSLLDRNRSLTSVMPHFTQKIVDTESIGQKSEEEEYNPETADFSKILAGDSHKPISPAEDEEAYDPEKVVFGDETKQEEEDDAPYDPEDEAERLENTELKALQEKQAFLEKMKQELEMKKAELAKEEMSLQNQTPPPPPPVKMVTQTRVDPRVAARMNKIKLPNNSNSDTTPPPSDETPLQKIYSVLNFDKTKAT